MDVMELDEASHTLEALIRQLGDVHLIILNAGVGHLNSHLNWKLEEEIIRTNARMAAWTCRFPIGDLSSAFSAFDQRHKSGELRGTEIKAG